MLAAHEQLDPVFKALADPTRRELLDLLRTRPQTTGDLAGHFTMSRFGVMKHLGILEEAGLVVVRRQGRERWNHLNAVPLQQIAERWMGPFEASWSAGLLRLKRHVEAATALVIARQGELTMPVSAPVLETVHTHSIAQELNLAATPAAVYTALTTNIGYWWGAPHVTGDAIDFILEAEPGGRFMQLYRGGGGTLWCTVTELVPDAVVELRGHLGMPAPVMGVIRFELEAKDQGTLLKLSHVFAGPVPTEVRDGYAEGWHNLLDNYLKKFVEEGIRSGARKT